MSKFSACGGGVPPSPPVRKTLPPLLLTEVLIYENYNWPICWIKLKLKYRVNIVISIKLVKLSLWQWPKIANYMGQPNSKSKKQQHQQVKKKGTILHFVTLVSIFFLNLRNLKNWMCWVKNFINGFCRFINTWQVFMTKCNPWYQPGSLTGTVFLSKHNPYSCYLAKSKEHFTCPGL